MLLQTTEEILKKYWGYSDFIYPQREIIESVLNGEDVLAILPTGGGKSICFQLPALILDGITLIISPLIALMLDQIQGLNSRGIPSAAITSQLSRDEIAVIITKCVLGEIKLLFVAPERIESRYFLETLQNLPIKLIAVDEAHCIIEWGFDFRPSYLKIHKLRKIFPSCNLLALTATAPPKTEKEIIERLGMRNIQIFKKSLKRENLTYKVVHSQNELDDLVYELKKLPGSAIVFVRTRKKSFEVARFLNEKGFDAQYFHSKLPKEEKNVRQQIWTKSENQIMVSTNAFGMGIDKPNVRKVIHLNLPDSMGAYVQEAGRAGRDGQEAEVVLFLQPYEIEDLEAIFKTGLPTKNEFEQIERSFYNYFEIGENERPDNPLEFDKQQFISSFKLNKKKTEKVFGFLERKEVVSFKESSNYSSIRVYSNPNFVSNSDSTLYKILEFLVRNYPGIMSEEKAVTEFYLAAELKKPVDKIRKKLQKMSEGGYIYYRKKEIQLVSFKRPRESNYIKNILWKEFESHQITQWKRLQDIIYYAGQNEVCREKLILRYFGENPIQKCGKCDVCIKHNEELPNELVLGFLGKDSKSIQEIVQHFVNYPKDSVLRTVEKLIDERQIINTGIDSYKVLKP